MDQIRRIEEAGFSSWPAPQHLYERGWLVRFGGGHTKRANSANPLCPGADDPDDLIRAVAAAYRKRGRPPIFRLTPLVDVEAFDRRLAALDYRLVEPSRVMVRPELDTLPQPSIPPELRLSIDPCLSAAWLAAIDRIQPIAPVERPARERILAAIAAPTAYAALHDGGDAVAVLLGVVTGAWFTLHSVATHPDRRGHGLMRALIGAVGVWARRQGAAAGQLFVVAGNAPAERLYEGLGYRELYRYHYRIG
jgi:GNAT superfamily N-acetyltransferase